MPRAKNKKVFFSPPNAIGKKIIVVFFLFVFALVVFYPSISKASVWSNLWSSQNPENPYEPYLEKHKDPKTGQEKVTIGDPNAPGTFESAITGATTSILSGILSFCILLAKMSASFLEVLLKPELYNFNGEKWITEGWIVVRDLCNMFFLLVLLFIAFCTILQVEKYHAKKTLLTLIIIALLINFSKPIAIFIFDGSQLLMNLFLVKISAAQNNGQKYTEGIANAVKITETLKDNVAAIYKGKYMDIAHYLFAIIFVFMFAVCLLCMAIFLIIRIIVVWMLIILSPMGFFASTIPDFKKLSSSWWDALFKYSYFGPAFAFFVWLSGKMAITLTKDGGSTILKAANTASKNFVANAFESMVSLLPFVTVLVFLYASLIMAQQFGIQFAKAVTDRAGKIMTGGIRRLTGYHYASNFARSHYKHATGAGKEWLKQRFPRAHKWFTEEGREKSRQQFWDEKVFRTKTASKRQQKDIADILDKGKKEGFTKDDWYDLLDPLNRTASSSEKMAAALALAKEGDIKDGAQYKAGLDALATAPKALQDAYQRDTKKKNIHAVIEEEITRTGATGAAAQAIYDKHLNSIKLAELGDQNISGFRDAAGNFKTEFVNWANYVDPTAPPGTKGRLENLHPGIKNDIAKKLNAKDYTDFNVNKWI